MSIFSEKLKLTRQQHNLTQKNIADFLEISERSYQNYEYGNREPNFNNTVKIADYFNCSIDYLLGRTNNPEVNK